MREIRPIREQEADAFLELLCSVFGLDLGRASHVFYHEPLYDLSRKWAVFEGREIVSILTTTPLEFGWGMAIGIAGVATKQNRRGQGIAGQLLERVLREADRNNEHVAFLFANRPDVYQRAGFRVVDHVIRAPILAARVFREQPYISESDVRRIYNTWASAHPDRLRRDDRRWKLWQFNMRRGVPLLGGYACAEGGLLRECVPFELAASWPLERGTEWFGLHSMASQLGMPLGEIRRELLLMSRAASAPPQMFMTDQF
jgi:GNAT superfamily N-acetyltransferase